MKKEDFPDLQAVTRYLKHLQNTICDALLEIDENNRFTEDTWHHANGGGGVTRVLSQVGVFEKGGVNFSHVKGESLPASASAGRDGIAGKSFEATGVSLVLHPSNPYAPTCHMNVRFFMAMSDSASPTWWFGGGYDLTPYYGFVEDCEHWHKTAKSACDPFGEALYPKYKRWCDDYFFLKHRGEPRGIGGLFFDDVNDGGFDRCFRFLQSIGDSFIPAYRPIVIKRKDMAFGEKERQFQCYRRGRYVEFNLVYDRGTIFGLQSGGRTESILMSMPPEVRWVYNWQPSAGSPEEELYEFYLKPRDWVSDFI